MKKQVFYLFLFSLIVFLSACEFTQITTFDMPYEGKKAVLIGFVGTDRRAEVFIDATVPVLNNKPDSLGNSEVRLFEDKIFKTHLTKTTDDLYIAPENFAAQTGKAYHIEVKIPNLPPLSTEADLIPIAVKIDSLSFKFTDTSRSDGTVRLQFTDPFGKNYYAYRIERFKDDTLLDMPLGRSFRFLHFSEVFDDLNFEGRPHVLNDKISLSTSLNQKPVKANKLRVTLYSISTATYRFFKSIDEQDFARGDYYSEPSKVFSNVKDGYGVFGAYNFNQKDIEL
jgi:hypothetical protein